jgi:hypothetical protein
MHDGDVKPQPAVQYVPGRRSVTAFYLFGPFQMRTTTTLEVIRYSILPRILTQYTDLATRNYAWHTQPRGHGIANTCLDL